MGIGIIIKKIKAFNRNILQTFEYILNIDNQGELGDKVEFSDSENFLYDDIDKQIEEMEVRHKEYKYNGGKVTPDMHLTLSYPTTFIMNKEEYRKDVKAVLRHLGMENNSCLWAVHSNTKNTHIHIYIDRIDPVKIDFDSSKGTCFEITKAGTVRRHESNCFQAACYEISTKYAYPRSQYRVDEKGNPQNQNKSTHTRVNPKDAKAVNLAKKANKVINDFMTSHGTSWNALIKEFASQGIEYSAISAKSGKTRGAVLIDKENGYRLKSSVLPIGHKELEKEIGPFPFIPIPAVQASSKKKEKQQDYYKEAIKRDLKEMIIKSNSWEDFNTFLSEYNYYMEMRASSFAIVYDETDNKKESIAPSKIDRAYSYANLKKKWGETPQGIFREFEKKQISVAPKKKKSYQNRSSRKVQPIFYARLKTPQADFIVDKSLFEEIKKLFKTKYISKILKTLIIEFEDGYTLKVKPDRIILASYKNEDELILAIHSMIELGLIKGWKLENFEFSGSDFFKERAYMILHETYMDEEILQQM